MPTPEQIEQANREEFERQDAVIEGLRKQIRKLRVRNDELHEKLADREERLEKIADLTERYVVSGTITVEDLTP